jgi:UDP:flavonoid glycosyltransferase YjiC (YdhE family)
LKRILVAPLNWGLGHVARCIPLIQVLHDMGAEVLLASDGGALRLLKAEFPDLRAFQLPSYRIRYDSPNMVRNIAWQLPRIVYAVRAEQWAVERLVNEHKIQGIISDNRYGCFAPRVKSAILTHQLHLRVPGGFLEWSANRVLRRALSKFDEVWVPDVADNPNLSGELSHGEPVVHPNIQFVGPLSRLQLSASEHEYDVAVVLSGPEPQRTYLEQRLLEQAMLLPQKFIFIQGKTRAKEHQYVAENVEVVSYFTSSELNEVLLASDVIVCRSGYSSIMDLAALGKKALLIPTPGQTEQEYLADFFAQQNIFLVQKQDDIDLETGLEKVAETTGFQAGQFETQAFRPYLEQWLNSL